MKWQYWCNIFALIRYIAIVSRYILSVSHYISKVSSLFAKKNICFFLRKWAQWVFVVLWFFFDFQKCKIVQFDSELFFCDKENPIRNGAIYNFFELVSWMIKCIYTIWPCYLLITNILNKRLNKHSHLFLTIHLFIFW